MLRKIISVPPIDIINPLTQATPSGIQLSIPDWYHQFGAIFGIVDQHNTEMPLVCFVSKHKLEDMDPHNDTLRDFFRSWTLFDTLSDYLNTTATNQVRITPEVISGSITYTIHIAAIENEFHPSISLPGINHATTALLPYRLITLDCEPSKIVDRLRTRLGIWKDKIDAIQQFLTYSSLFLSFARHTDNTSNHYAPPKFPSEKADTLYTILGIYPTCMGDVTIDFSGIKLALDTATTKYTEQQAYYHLPELEHERCVINLLENHHYHKAPLCKEILYALTAIQQALGLSWTGIPTRRIPNTLSLDEVMAHYMSTATQTELWDAVFLPD